MHRLGPLLQDQGLDPSARRSVTPYFLLAAHGMAWHSMERMRNTPTAKEGSLHVPDHICQTRAVHHPREGGCDRPSLHPQINRWVMLGCRQLPVPGSGATHSLQWHSHIYRGWAVKPSYPQKDGSQGLTACPWSGHFRADCCSGVPMPSLVLAACSSTDSLLVQVACGYQ